MKRDVIRGDRLYLFGFIPLWKVKRDNVDRDFGEFRMPSKELWSVKADFFYEDKKMLVSDVAIFKSILLKSLSGCLSELEGSLEKERKRASGINAHVGPFYINELESQIELLEWMESLILSLPEFYYKIEKLLPECYRLEGLDGVCYELTLVKSILGGNIFELRNVGTDIAIEFMPLESENYLGKIEKNCINGYFIPDSEFSAIISRLNKNEEKNA